MILEIIVLILAIPVGYLLAWMARDELISGRKWFKIIILLSLILSIIFLILKEIVIFFTLIFILIVTLISFIKSSDRKWTRER